MFFEIVSLIAVGFCWGGTNPIIRRNSKNIVKVEASSAIGQFFLDLKYLATNIWYVLPWLVNQSGSVIYFLTLQSTDLTLSVPLANSLTFVFTAIVSWILEEKLLKKRTIIGVILILLGTFLCCWDKF
ncbi:unnamed protein product [Acanthoscelides obtectus]|uniref:Transmembrane protein 234 homolog n=1 Tax=Acanthoscelides obtectus TaxID=200917 RepID=A0A9P0LY93_ACAOB|nr:unnamed protein product [Acanthoscelides obtectus]CAK1658560.1 Transmembrane protein 234 homolog [Acanthoscelides obtectus]